MPWFRREKYDEATATRLRCRDNLERKFKKNTLLQRNEMENEISYEAREIFDEKSRNQETSTR